MTRKKHKMNKHYEVFQRKRMRSFLIALSNICIFTGVMLILSSFGLLPWVGRFLNGFNNELSFLAGQNGQLMTGIFLCSFFTWVLLKNFMNFIKRKPILIADDFGLEVSQIVDYRVIGWEYIDKISIERYAKSNSQGKRPTLIIRYRKTGKETIFIPLYKLSDTGKNVLEELALRNKQIKF